MRWMPVVKRLHIEMWVTLKSYFVEKMWRRDVEADERQHQKLRASVNRTGIFQRLTRRKRHATSAVERRP